MAPWTRVTRSAHRDRQLEARENRCAALDAGELRAVAVRAAGPVRVLREAVIFGEPETLGEPVTLRCGMGPLEQPIFAAFWAM